MVKSYEPEKSRSSSLPLSPSSFRSSSSGFLGFFEDDDDEEATPSTASAAGASARHSTGRAWSSKTASQRLDATSQTRTERSAEAENRRPLLASTAQTISSWPRRIVGGRSREDASFGASAVVVVACCCCRCLGASFSSSSSSLSSVATTAAAAGVVASSANREAAAAAALLRLLLLLLSSLPPIPARPSPPPPPLYSRAAAVLSPPSSGCGTGTPSLRAHSATASRRAKFGVSSRCRRRAPVAGQVPCPAESHRSMHLRS